MSNTERNKYNDDDNSMRPYRRSTYKSPDGSPPIYKPNLNARCSPRVEFRRYYLTTREGKELKESLRGNPKELTKQLNNIYDDDPARQLAYCPGSYSRFANFNKIIKSAKGNNWTGETFSRHVSQYFNRPN